MSRKSQITGIVGIFLIPSAAQAHGEEILATIGAQVLAIIACIIVSIVVVKRIPHRILAIGGSFVGVYVSWLITSGWPYFSNQVEITLIDVGLPIIGTALILTIIKVASNE